MRAIYYFEGEEHEELRAQARRFGAAQIAPNATALTGEVASRAMAGEAVIAQAAMAKNAAADACSWVADQAVQIHGGYGYMRESIVERLYRDARLYAIGLRGSREAGTILDMSDVNVISAKEQMLTELYKGAAAIGDQRVAMASSDNQAEQDMLAAIWNDCQLEIDKVRQAPDDDNFQDALDFLERSFVSDS